MRQVSPAGQQVINGNMAQYSHPKFSGSGQWMRGGMTMVSDMFNNRMEGRVDSLCFELSHLIASQPDLIRSGSFQSRNQGNSYNHGQSQTSYGSGQQQGGGSNSGAGFGPSSLFVPPAPGTSGNWWPADLRTKGILSDEEFSTKKSELLSRV